MVAKGLSGNASQSPAFCKVRAERGSLTADDAALRGLKSAQVKTGLAASLL